MASLSSTMRASGGRAPGWSGLLRGLVLLAGLLVVGASHAAPAAGRMDVTLELAESLRLSQVESSPGAVHRTAVPALTVESGLSDPPPQPDVLPLPAPPVEPVPVQGAGDPALLTLAPGDLVTVTVFGRPELTSTANVSEAGRIEVPLAGSVEVAGLSPARAAERVATAYRDGQFLVNPQVNIVLSGLRSQQISVLGEVARPGRYPIETRTTVLDALALAGGIRDVGDQKVFVLRQSGDRSERLAIDLQGVFESGDGPVTELRAGDTLIVPRARLFYIHGEVRNPNSYALRPNLTLIEAISMAGGLTPRGSSRRVEVRRKTGAGGMETRSLDVNDPVFPEDVINVKERLF